MAIRIIVSSRADGPRETARNYSSAMVIVLAILIFFAGFIAAASIFMFGVPDSKNLHSYIMKTIKAPTSNSMDGKIRSNHTIITAYFLVNKTKRHSDSNYIELMERLFSNSDPMIIYTSPEVAPLLAEIRGKPERTVVIPMNLSDTNLVKRYPRPAFWESVSKDGRGAGINNGYDYNLYQIWNSKVDFLKLGSDMNPFQSNFFAWMDAGFVRWDEYTNSTIIQRIPPELPETKLAIMNITPIIHFKTHHQMGGGTFGGYKPAVDLYHAKYYEKFHEYANSTDRYTHVSNEQLVLYETCRDNDGLCFTINPRKSNNNAISWGLQVPYFYMLPFFNTREYEEMEEKNFVDKSRW